MPAPYAGVSYSSPKEDNNMSMPFPRLRAGLLCCALPLCALPFGSASAQASPSSVTLYGTIDVAVEKLSNGPGPTNKPNMISGGLSGSRWGIKGSEDLGGGLNAIYTLESGFDVSDGTLLQGGRLFGRQAYIGLSDKSWGQLMAGRQNTLMIDWISKYNPFGNGNYSAKRVDGAFSDRADNALKYTGKFGAFSLGALYSFGWNNDQDAEDSKVGRMYSAGVRYQQDGLDAAVLYHVKHANKPGLNADSNNREQRIAAGLSYKTGAFQVYGGYRWLKQELTTQNYTSNMYWAGASYQVSKPATLSLALYYLDGTTCDNLNAAACPAAQQAGKDQKPWLFVLGADYQASKRTTFYATGAYALNRHDSSLSVIGGKFSENVNPGANQFGLNIGMRHSF